MNNKKNNQSNKNQRGQSLVEFVLLFLVTVTVSFALLAFVNNHVADVWKAMVTTIVGPTSESIEFR